MVSLEGKIKMSEKYIITAAQMNASPNKAFMRSLETYASYNNAEIKILPMSGASIKDEQLHKAFSTYDVITSNHNFNSKIKVSNFEVKPQQIDPITGLARFAQDDVSTIFAATKQRLKVIPNSNTALPKILMTTGACTLPNYRDNRIGNIAKKDHTYGAIMLEIENGTKYHFRHISALNNGKFQDLNMLYNGSKKPIKVRPEAMILGDWHTGETNPEVRDETFRMIKAYNPKRVIMHDFFNGYSINHWEKGNVVALARHPYELDLEKELISSSKELAKIKKICGEDTELVLVKSNHDDRLDRYISAGTFMEEPINTKIGAELLLEKLEGYDILESGLRRFEQLGDIKFLKLDEDYKVRGWQLGNHGHIGAHGARGSIRTIEYANGKSITGHTHVPQIFRNVYQVGTSTNLKLDYNKGFSAWMNTHGMLYKTGKPQLINIIDGKHKGGK